MLALETKPLPLSIGPDHVIRVSGTRVPLETIVAAFDAGATAEEIVQQYPSVELADAYAVISWVLENRTSVDEYVRQRRDAAKALREEIERRDPAAGIRARLLARRPSTSG